MKRLFVVSAAVLAAASLAMGGCAQPAPAPAQAPAAPPKAAEPAKAPAAAPAAAAPAPAPKPAPAPAPAKKVEFPEKGKSITLIAPWTAGSISDINARTLAPVLEKELGVPVQIVNKPGAGSQIGVTELVKSKPDGYTIGLTNIPPTIGIYLEPERKAVFGRKDLQPLAMLAVDPVGIGVKTDSPYKSVKDLVDAAKANPGKVKVASPALLGTGHFGILWFEKLAGVKFATVHFEGTAPTMNALLGGHVDAAFPTAGAFVPHVKSGAVRVLAIMDKQESKFFPGVPTAESQGYKLDMIVGQALSAPAGTPKEIVDILSNAIKKAMATDEYTKKMTDAGLEPRYMDPAQFSAFWDKMEGEIKALMALVKQS